MTASYSWPRRRAAGLRREPGTPGAPGGGEERSPHAAPRPKHEAPQGEARAPHAPQCACALLLQRAREGLGCAIRSRLHYSALAAVPSGAMNGGFRGPFSATCRRRPTAVFIGPLPPTPSLHLDVPFAHLRLIM